MKSFYKGNYLYLEVYAGESINNACKEAFCLKEKLNCDIKFNFNGKTFNTAYYESPEEMIEAYRK